MIQSDSNQSLFQTDLLPIIPVAPQMARKVLAEALLERNIGGRRHDWHSTAPSHLCSCRVRPTAIAGRRQGGGVHRSYARERDRCPVRKLSDKGQASAHGFDGTA